MNAKAQEYLEKEFTPSLKKVFSDKIDSSDFKLICNEEKVVKFIYSRSIQEEFYLKP
jgi:hypothetical protein